MINISVKALDGTNKSFNVDEEVLTIIIILYYNNIFFVKSNMYLFNIQLNICYLNLIQLLLKYVDFAYVSCKHLYY